MNKKLLLFQGNMWKTQSHKVQEKYIVLININLVILVLVYCRHFHFYPSFSPPPNPSQGGHYYNITHLEEGVPPTKALESTIWRPHFQRWHH